MVTSGQTLNFHTKEDCTLNNPVHAPPKKLSHFARRLLSIGAVKIDTKMGFKLKLHQTNPTAPLSPYYFNLRIANNKGGPLTYTEVNDVGSFFYEYLKEHAIEYQGIAGVPRAGEPFAKALQEIVCHGSPEGYSLPLLTLEKEEGETGRKIGKVIKTQDLPRGSRVLLLDDLITRADSKKEAVDQLRNAEFEVTDILVFLDREQGATAELKKSGITLHSIATVSSLLKIYEDEHFITPQDVAKIRVYMATNQ